MASKLLSKVASKVPKLFAGGAASMTGFGDALQLKGLGKEDGYAQARYIYRGISYQSSGISTVRRFSSRGAPPRSTDGVTDSAGEDSTTSADPRRPERDIPIPNLFSGEDSE